MAPTCPEEVDVFTIPHSRMKELVYKYIEQLTATNFSNAVHLTNLLENLCSTFHEFIAHEQIENQFIMKKLKNKLRSLSIQNTAVCNCHKDNQLLDMLHLLEDGYRSTKKTAVDMNNFGLKLRQALESFTETFLPHMAEEEEVFQPLLMQHFTFDELKQIKATVLQQHFKVEPDETPEKGVQDNKSSKQVTKSSVKTSTTIKKEQPGFDLLPAEIVLKIFSDLNPRDLCRASQVSTRWRDLAIDGSLWTELYPVRWATGTQTRFQFDGDISVYRYVPRGHFCSKYNDNDPISSTMGVDDEGDWDSTMGVDDEGNHSYMSKLEGQDGGDKTLDEDADIDESDDWDQEAQQIQYESRMLTSMCRHLLPRVGSCVRLCNLAYSKGVTNGTLYKILSLCPNLEHVDLTQTRVSDLGFKGLQKKGCGQQLRHLDLSGCLYITDLTLRRISDALGQIPCHMNEKDGYVSVKLKNRTENSEDVCENNSEIETSKTCFEDDNIETFDHKNKVKAEKVSNFENKICNGKSSETSNITNEETCNRCCGSDIMEDIETKRIQQNGQLNDPQTNGCDVKNLKNRQLSTCCRDNERSKTNCCGQNNNGIKTPGTAECDCGSEKSPNCDVEETDVRNGKELETIENYPSSSSEPPSQIEPRSRSHEGQKAKYISTEKNVSQRVKELKINVEGTDGNETFKGSTEDVFAPDLMSEEKAKMLNKDLTGEETPADLGVTWLPDFIMSQRSNMADLDLQHNDLDANNSVSCTQNKQQNDKDCENDTTQSSQDYYKHVSVDTRHLEFLSLSGCYQVTDDGIESLTNNGGLPYLRHLDLSGCLNLGGVSVSRLVTTTTQLDPSNLYYCDNILDGPYWDTASGCRNLQCESRFCCRCGE